MTGEVRTSLSAQGVPSPLPDQQVPFSLDNGLDLVTRIARSTLGESLKVLGAYQGSPMPHEFGQRVRQLLQSTRTPEEIALQVRHLVYTHFERREEAQQCLRQLQVIGRTGQFAAYARRHMTITPKKMEVVVSNLFHPYELTIFNFTGQEMVVSKGVGDWSNSTVVAFPKIGFACPFSDDTECLAFMNLEIARDPKYNNLYVMDLLWLDSGKTSIVHKMYYFGDGKFLYGGEDPPIGLSLNRELTTIPEHICPTPILGLTVREAAGMISNFQLYEGRYFQILRFNVRVLRRDIETLTQLFSLAVAEYIICSGVPELILYRPKGDPYPAVLERSTITPHIPPEKRVTIFNFMATRKNTSLSRWQFNLPPKFETEAKESAYRMADINRWNRHARASFSHWMVAHALKDTPFEDCWGNGIAFTDQEAVVGNTDYLMRRFVDAEVKGGAARQVEQKSGAPAGGEALICKRITDDVSRISVLTQLVQGFIRPTVQEQNYRTDEPVFLFEEPVPTLVRCTEKKIGDRRVLQISSNHNIGREGFQLSTEVPYERDVRGRVYSFPIGPHFNIHAGLAHNAFTMYPYGSGASSVPFMLDRFSYPQRHVQGKRMWSVERKAPDANKFALLNALGLMQITGLPPELDTIVVDYASGDAVKERSFA